MSFWSRAKSLMGGERPIVSIPSASTIIIPDCDNAFLITGTTAIATITSASHLVNREVTLIGSACNVSLTNNNSPSTGQLYLRGTDRNLTDGVVVKLIRLQDGSWTLASVF